MKDERYIFFSIMGEEPPVETINDIFYASTIAKRSTFKLER